LGTLNERDQLENLAVIWKDNIKMALREMGWEGLDWIHLVQDRVTWWLL
jgi:hypothetical protein